ncbi:MAG: PIN domain-containing protein [Candidatus Woesearchaeota archaeon]|nr:PIN domain-containing protein [Candidatus Woesearchaeota archaeon]
MILLVIDANILFSALIKDSITAELLFQEGIVLSTPEFIMQEFLKYEEEISKKTSRTKEEFIQIMHMLKDIIAIVPNEEYSGFMDEAEKISPDKKDIMYLALALKLNCGIWSNDKKLKCQDKVRVYSTEDLIKIVNG